MKPTTWRKAKMGPKCSEALAPRSFSLWNLPRSLLHYPHKSANTFPLGSTSIWLYCNSDTNSRSLHLPSPYTSFLLHPRPSNVCTLLNPPPYHKPTRMKLLYLMALFVAAHVGHCAVIQLPSSIDLLVRASADDLVSSEPNTALGR